MRDGMYGGFAFVAACWLLLAGCQDILGLKPGVPAGEQAEVCDDTEDNDGDGDIDCADLDCADDASCQEVCDDGEDNDADGDVDCADIDCLGDPVCPELCDDAVDNDGDELVDCADGDCVGAPVCAALFVATGARGTVGSLFRVDPETAHAVEVVALNRGYTGLAFAPDGRLFGAVAPGGIGKFRHAGLGGGGESRELVEIDLITGEERVVGLLADGVGQGAPIPDLSFVGEQLIGWSEGGDVLIQIDETSGAFATVGPGVGSAGSGLASDADGNTFFVPDETDRMFRVDPTSGELVELGVLVGVPLDKLNSMTFFNGTLFGVATEDIGGESVHQSRLVSIDPDSLMVIDIGPLPPDIDSIAGTTP